MNRFQYHHYQNDEYMSVDPQYHHDSNQTSTSYAQPFRNHLDPRRERCSLDLIPENLNRLESSAYTPSATQTGTLPNWWSETKIMTNSNFWPQPPRSPRPNYQCEDSTMMDVSIRYSSPNIDAPLPDTFPRHFNSVCDPRLLERGGMDVKTREPSDDHYGFQDSQMASPPRFCHGLMDADTFRGVDLSRLTLDQSSIEDDIHVISPSLADYNYTSLPFSRLGDEDYRDFNSLDEPVAPEGPGEEPYAKLIYKALMTKESRSMVLQEIYEWFTVNTNKADSKTKGWQNSIRHNLSMNGAFVKRDRMQCGEDSKRHCEWVLDPVAEKEGVKSTTRYRNKIHGKRIAKHEPPSGARQNSGRLGGQRSAGRFRAQKQQKIKTEPSDRLEPHSSGELSAPKVDSLTYGIRPYPKQRSQSPQHIKIEGADPSHAPYYKQDPPAFGNVKGIFEDPSLYDLPPFVGDDVSCLSPIPEVKYDYQFH